MTPQVLPLHVCCLECNSPETTGNSRFALLRGRRWQPWQHPEHRQDMLSSHLPHFQCYASSLSAWPVFFFGVHLHEVPPIMLHSDHSASLPSPTHRIYLGPPMPLKAHPCRIYHGLLCINLPQASMRVHQHQPASIIIFVRITGSLPLVMMMIVMIMLMRMMVMLTLTLTSTLTLMSM